MITELERTKEPNLWEGIYFYPDAAPDSRFMATTIEGRRTRTIGLFPTLETAVLGRDSYLAYHANKPTVNGRETATYPKHYETRSIDA